MWLISHLTHWTYFSLSESLAQDGARVCQGQASLSEKPRWLLDEWGEAQLWSGSMSLTQTIVRLWSCSQVQLITRLEENAFSFQLCFIVISHRPTKTQFFTWLIIQTFPEVLFPFSPSNRQSLFYSHTFRCLQGVPCNSVQWAPPIRDWWVFGVIRSVSFPHLLTKYSINESPIWDAHLLFYFKQALRYNLTA